MRFTMPWALCHISVLNTWHSALVAVRMYESGYHGKDVEKFHEKCSGVSLHVQITSLCSHHIGVPFGTLAYASPSCIDALLQDAFHC